MKVCLVGIFYPLAMLRYFERALKRREDIELISVGPFTNNWIPWKGGMTLPMKYARPPTFPLPQTAINVGKINPAVFENYATFKDVDLWIEVDAGFYLDPKPSHGIVAHVATDPHCISGDTLLATNKGILFAEEAVNSCVNQIADKSSMRRVAGVISSGWQNLITLKLENGYEITCTDNHKIETRDYGFRCAKDLKIGDKPILAFGTYSPPEGLSYEYSIGFVIGAFQGDGSFGSSDIVKFTTGTEKKEELRNVLRVHLENGFGIETTTTSKHYTNENTTILQVRRYGLHRFLKSLNLKDGHIPYFIRTGTRSLIGGYIAGLLATDGCSVNELLQITTKWENLAKELQILLSYLGVITSRKQTISGKSSYKPGQKYWVLHIRAGESCKNLFELTGYIPGKIINIHSRKRGISSGNLQEFKILEIKGIVKNYPHLRVSEPVYDVMNSDSETFLANCISVHNCLDYSRQRQLADFFFNMQKVYSIGKDIYLPYAYDPTVHYYEEHTKIHDAAIIGLHYDQRNQLVQRLKDKGYEIFYDIGQVFDEYRLVYNSSKVGLNWSSMQDLNARAFELPAMKICPVMNKVPDMDLFFEEDVDYLSFSNLEEAVMKVELALSNPHLMIEIAENAYKKVEPHTYDNRVKQILETVGLV